MERYDFMYKNKVIGTLTCREIEDFNWFDFKLIRKDIPVEWLPKDMYGYKNININKSIGIIDVMKWLSFRNYSQRQQCVSELLYLNELKSTGLWNIIKQVNGVSWKDDHWLRPVGSTLYYEQFHPRYLKSKGYPINYKNPYNIEYPERFDLLGL